MSTRRESIFSDSLTKRVCPSLLKAQLMNSLAAFGFGARSTTSQKDERDDRREVRGADADLDAVGFGYHSGFRFGTRHIDA